MAGATFRDSAPVSSWHVQHLVILPLHFFGQVQHLVILSLQFLWQAQHLVILLLQFRFCYGVGGRQKTKRCEGLFKGVSTLINVYNVDVTANFKLYLGEKLRAIMHLCTYSPLNRRLQCFVFRGKVPTFRKTFNVFNASVFSDPFPSAAFAVLVFRFFCFLDVLFWADF